MGTVRFYSAISFCFDGKIVLKGYGELKSFVEGEWHKVKQIIDRSNDTCSVWINDVLRASNVDLATNEDPSLWPERHYNDTEAFSLYSSMYASIEAYVDDVKIFQYEPSTSPYTWIHL